MDPLCIHGLTRDEDCTACQRTMESLLAQAKAERLDHGEQSKDAEES